MVVKVVVMMMVVVPFTIVKWVNNLILLNMKRLREVTLIVIAKAVTTFPKISDMKFNHQI